MATTRIVCPECNASLRPAQPVPDGKRVKCPKCGAVFASPGAAAFADEDEQMRAAPRQAARAATGKKKAVPPAEAPTIPPPAAKAPDDDDEGGTYRVVGAGEQEQEEKPDIDYAPDLGIKDLRGPAQAAVVAPSNQMMLFAAVGCLMCLVGFCLLLWPFVFSDYLIDHGPFLEAYYKKMLKDPNITPNEVQAIQTKLRAFSGAPPDRKLLKEEELKVLARAEHDEMIWRVVAMAILAVVLVFDAVITVGAIKTQHLESRQWGLVASIMAIIPVIGAGGYMLVAWKAIGQLSDMVIEEVAPGTGATIQQVVVGALALWPIGIGVWSLMTLLKPEVIAGFEYKSD
jgi:predicted Zn finger-like uncharacterized protein